MLDSSGTILDPGLTPEGPAVGAGLVIVAVVSMTEVVATTGIVEAVVTTMVETVVVGTRTVEPPVVIVFVTGQVVTVV